MKPKTVAAVGFEMAVVGGVYLRFGRPWVLSWGAHVHEADMALPGDEILKDATLQTTRAISIEAPPNAVWPWLAQMGPRPRAGAYTYDWIERLLGIDIENSDRILPEFQHLEPGEFMGLNKKGEGLPVVSVEPERSLVLQWVPQNSTWTFALEPEGEAGTRLISRNRLPDTSTWFGLPASKLVSKVFMVAFMEPGSLVMERKMLLGIKRRAERLYRGELAAAAGSESALSIVGGEGPEAS